MNRIDEAVSLFENGHACSQAVLMAFSETFGLDRTDARGLAAGFGAGMRAGDTCGAVTGAFMALGLALAPEWSEESRQTVNSAVIELRERFVARHGSDRCETLLGCNPTTPEGQKQATEQGLFRSACPVFVRDVAEILEDMIAERRTLTA